jgi:hypothetical protein
MSDGSEQGPLKDYVDANLRVKTVPIYAIEKRVLVGETPQPFAEWINPLMVFPACRPE